MNTKIIKILKNKSIKLVAIMIMIITLGYTVSSIATSDIKTSTANFSSMGIVSDISEKYIKINQAKGSNNTSQTEYELNIKNIENIQTDKYVPISINDIKIGDKIIAQGLSNGSDFFVKRIISFSSDFAIKEDKTIATSTVQSDEVKEVVNASSTDLNIATSGDSIINKDSENIVTEDVIASSTVIIGSYNTGGITSTSTTSAVATSTDLISTSTSDVASSTDVSTSTDISSDIGIGTTTQNDVIATSTSDASTSVEIINNSNSTTTESIVENVVNIVTDIVDTVTETVTEMVNNIVNIVE